MSSSGVRTTRVSGGGEGGGGGFFGSSVPSSFTPSQRGSQPRQGVTDATRERSQLGGVNAIFINAPVGSEKRGKDKRFGFLNMHERPGEPRMPLHVAYQCNEPRILNGVFPAQNVDHLLENYTQRRRMHLIKEKKKNDTGSRLASAQECAFYHKEMDMLRERMKDVEQEIADLGPHVEETLEEIGKSQEAMLKCVEEHAALENGVRDISVREHHLIEEKHRLEEEYFTRLCMGLSEWPDEVHTAARQFLHTVKDQNPRVREVWRDYGTWLDLMRQRGPMKSTWVATHQTDASPIGCKVEIMRKAFLGRR